MNSALLQQLNSVCHSGVLHNVCNTRHQLKIGHDEYPHPRFGNVLHTTHTTNFLKISPMRD